MSSELIALVGILIAALPGLFALRLQRRKVDTDTWEKVVQTSATLMDKLREDNEFLREQVDDQQTIIQNLRDVQVTLQETLNAALARIQGLEIENSALGRDNRALTHQLAEGIDGLYEQATGHRQRRQAPQ